MSPSASAARILVEDVRATSPSLRSGLPTRSIAVTSKWPQPSSRRVSTVPAAK